MKTNLHFRSYLAQFSLESEMFQAEVVEKIKTHILCSVTFFLENRAVYYEIMWKNTVQPDRPQMAIWRICIAFQIPKAKNKLSEYVIRIALPLQQWLHERASIPHNMCTSCLVNNSPKQERCQQ